MTTSPLSLLGQPGRSLEWLLAPGALMSSTALSTSQLAALGPIASLVESGTEPTSAGDAASDPLSSVVGTANQAVLGIHASLENAGHEITPLNGPLHALTNLGETIGLGKIGEPGNLLTDLTAVPQALSDGGGLGSAVPLLDDTGKALVAADGLVSSVVTGATGANPLAADGLLSPVSGLANAAATDVGATLGGLGQDLPALGDALHGLAALSSGIGLGHLGTPGNLLTDLAGLPGGLISGDGLDALSPVLADLGGLTGSASGLLHDVIQIPGDLVGGADGVLAPVTSLLGGVTGGATLSALDGLVGGLTGDGGALAPLTSLLGVGDVTGGLTGNLLGDGSPLQPVAGAANGLIDSIHAGIEDTGHQLPILNDPLHQVINLGTSVGLGALGEGDNLLTNVADLPGQALSGNIAGGLGGVTESAGHVVDAVGGVLGSLPGVVDGVLSGDAGAGLPLGGLLGGIAGGGAPIDGVLAPVTSILDGVTGGGAAGGVLAPVTAILDGATGGGSPVDGVLAPVTSILHDATGGGSPVDGVLAPVTSILDGMTSGGAAGGVLAPVTAILDGAIGGGSGTPIDGVLAPVTSVLDGVTGGGAAGGVLAPITAILDGATGGGSGTPVDGVLAPVTSILDGVTGGGGATHPLIDVSAGPTTSAPVADVSVLAPPSDTSHTIQIGAVGVGADQPSLVNASLLNGDSLPLPTTGAGGADSLVGQVLDLVHSGTSGPVATSSHSGIDLGIAAIDLGGHVDLHHADPTPHGATGGLHLLGL